MSDESWLTPDQRAHLARCCTEEGRNATLAAWREWRDGVYFDNRPPELAAREDEP